MNVVRLYVVGSGRLGAGAIICRSTAISEKTFQFECACQSPWSWSWPGVVILVVVAVFSEKYSVRIRPGLEVSASFLAFLLSAALIGPIAAFVAGAISPILVIDRRQPRLGRFGSPRWLRLLLELRGCHTG